MFWNESEIWNGIMHQYILLSHIVLVPYGWNQTHTQLEMVHAVDNIIESQRFTNSHRIQTTDKTMLAWMIFMGFKNHAVKCGRKFTGATRQLFALVFCFVILHCRWECNMMFWRVQLNLIWVWRWIHSTDKIWRTIKTTLLCDFKHSVIIAQNLESVLFKKKY